VGFGYNQVQIDIIAAVQLYSAVKGLIPQRVAAPLPQLLDDPLRCDRMQVSSLSDRLGHGHLVLWNHGGGGHQKVSGL